INPAGNDDPRSFTDLNGTLLFSASTPQTGAELWRSDGTEAGTELVKELKPGTLGSGLGPGAVSGGVAYFGAGGLPGLFRSDGTADGTYQVSPAPSQVFGSVVAVGDTVFFLGADAATGLELWASDGTEQGTRRVKDINHTTAGSAPSVFLTMGGTTFFRARTSALGAELWKTDGTAD